LQGGGKRKQATEDDGTITRLTVKMLRQEKAAADYQKKNHKKTKQKKKKTGVLSSRPAHSCERCNVMTMKIAERFRETMEWHLQTRGNTSRETPTNGYSKGGGGGQRLVRMHGALPIWTD